jgi:hypothetical protein
LVDGRKVVHSIVDSGATSNHRHSDFQADSLVRKTNHKTTLVAERHGSNAMNALLEPFVAWVQSRKVELGLGVRVTTAAVVALSIALALRLNLPLWPVLTSIIVTQLSVGRSLKAALDYLVGTVGGAVYGAAVALLVPHSGEGSLLFVLVLAVAPLALIAALKPSLNVATITAIIVLLLPISNHSDPLSSAIDRVLEVAVGAISGLFVSFLVFPSRAHNQIRWSAARVIELMAGALNKLMLGLTGHRDNQALHVIQDGIGAALFELNALGIEAERERAARLSVGPDTGPLLRTLLRLRHDLVMIGRASGAPLPTDLKARLAEPLTDVCAAIARYLEMIAAALHGGGVAPTILPLHRALDGYRAEIVLIRQEGLTKGLPGEVAERFFALGFALEQMRQNLKDLERCVVEWAGDATSALGQAGGKAVVE